MSEPYTQPPRAVRSTGVINIARTTRVIMSVFPSMLLGNMCSGNVRPR